MGTVVGTVVEECRELFEGQCSDKDHTQQLRLPTSLSVYRLQIVSFAFVVDPLV